MAANLTGRTWRIWDRELEYGQLLYKRAVGELPEMESSKALAGAVRDFLRPDEGILDVGCGAGHYLRSLLREVDTPFAYTGVDATKSYVELARKAWAGHANVSFEVADVFGLPFPDSAYDVVISCNVFLHLPSIKTPLQELVRVARKRVLIRTLVGERSFRIQEVYSPETHPKSFAGDRDAEEFDDSGEPQSFHYYNIYSQSYIEKLLSRLPGVAGFRIYKDEGYDPDRIASEVLPQSAPDASRIIEGWQVNGYILQPWHFIEIDKVH